MFEKYLVRNVYTYISDVDSKKILRQEESSIRGNDRVARTKFRRDCDIVHETRPNETKARKGRERRRRRSMYLSIITPAEGRGWRKRGEKKEGGKKR